MATPPGCSRPVRSAMILLFFFAFCWDFQLHPNRVIPRPGAVVFDVFENLSGLFVDIFFQHFGKLTEPSSLVGPHFMHAHISEGSLNPISFEIKRPND